MGGIRLKEYPIIDLPRTGENFQRLREERGITVRDIQQYLGLEEPQAIYQWQKGRSLPTVDHLCALSALFDVTMNEILVLVNRNEWTEGDRVRHTRKHARKSRCVLLVMAA